MTKTPVTTSDDGSSSSEDLVEGVDYTIDAETGFWIFTSSYLLKRGTCCQSDCRHCPYGYGQPKG
jgi:hypothetical protein